MNFKLVAAMIAVVAVAGFSSAQAQDCGCGGGYGAYSGVVEGGFGGFGSYGSVGYGPSNCWRGISSSQASSLWSGYCTDDCSYKGPQRRKLCGRHRGGSSLLLADATVDQVTFLQFVADTAAVAVVL